MKEVVLLSVILCLGLADARALDACEQQPDGTRIAHPTDCSKYAVCSQGQTVRILPCPLGLHFNPEDSICDFEDRAGCKTLQPDDISTALEPVQLFSSGPTTGPSGTTCVAGGRCVNQPDGTMYASTDSTGYVVCQCQCQIAMPCPPGTAFNETLQTCAFPPSTGGGGVSNGCGAISCKSTVCAGKADGVLVENVGTTGYYSCQCGCPTAMPCPTGTKFNETAQVCTSITNGGSGTAGCAAISCSSTVCAGKGDGVLVENVGTTGYYSCQCGCPTAMPCPSGTKFNETAQVCTSITNGGSGTAGCAAISCSSTVCAGKGDGVLVENVGTTGYYSCQCGCPTAMPCPVGTKFNETAQACSSTTSGGSCGGSGSGNGSCGGSGGGNGGTGESGGGSGTGGCNGSGNCGGTGGGNSGTGESGGGSGTGGCNGNGNCGGNGESGGGSGTGGCNASGNCGGSGGGNSETGGGSGTGGCNGSGNCGGTGGGNGGSGENGGGSGTGGCNGNGNCGGNGGGNGESGGGSGTGGCNGSGNCGGNGESGGGSGTGGCGSGNCGGNSEGGNSGSGESGSGSGGCSGSGNCSGNGGSSSSGCSTVTCTSTVCVGFKDGYLIANSETTGYYNCHCGCPTAMPCPVGTKFNQAKQVCDHIPSGGGCSGTSSGNCGSSGNDSGDSGSGDSGSEDNGTGNGGNGDSENGSDSDSGSSAGAVCAKPNICTGQVNGTVVADTLANNYVVCNCGCPMNIICPDNSVFDADLKVCVFICEACDQIATAKDMALPLTVGKACGSDSKCGSQLDGTLLAVPHSSNYLVCQDGCELEMLCAPGTTFSDVLRTCVHMN